MSLKAISPEIIKAYDFKQLAKRSTNPCEKIRLLAFYNHLKMANLVWVSARSQHPNADPLKQEEFKKKFLKNSKQFCLKILILRMLRFGFKMKLDLVNKAA